MQSFSTVGLPTHRKVSYWNEVSDETFAPMEIAPGRKAEFDGRLIRESVGPLTFAVVRSSPASLCRTRAHASRASDPSYILVSPLAGSFSVEIDTESPFALQPSEFCLLDLSRAYRLSFTEETHTFCVVLSHQSLADAAPDCSDLAGTPIRPVDCMSQSLVSVFQTLSTALERERADRITPAFAHGVSSLIAAACSESASPATPLSRALRCREIKRFIGEQFHNPELGPELIARRFGISTRYLRLLFESSDEPVSTYLLRRRVERCAQLLQDPAWATKSITEIALRCGFNNLTHFGFVFKRRFGATPREYRRKAC